MMELKPFQKVSLQFPLDGSEPSYKVEFDQEAYDTFLKKQWRLMFFMWVCAFLNLGLFVWRL